MEGLEVSATDPYGGEPYALGYPPYAVDGCALAYVTPSGELRLRDLAGGSESVLAKVDEAPRRPAIVGDLVAWEGVIDGKVSVRVRGPHGTVTVPGSFDHAGEPRVAADSVVFTGWHDADDHGDTDVYLFTPSTGEVTAIATGPAQQRFPDVSATHIAWTDFTEDPDGALGDDSTDAADIVVLARATSEQTTRKHEGKQAFPMLGADGHLAYLDWGLVHPEPKFSAYEIPAGSDRWQWRRRHGRRTFDDDDFLRQAGRPRVAHRLGDEHGQQQHAAATRRRSGRARRDGEQFRGQGIRPQRVERDDARGCVRDEWLRHVACFHALRTPDRIARRRPASRFNALRRARRLPLRVRAPAHVVIQRRLGSWPQPPTYERSEPWKRTARRLLGRIACANVLSPTMLRLSRSRPRPRSTSRWKSP
ncbi:MAG: hypothetical protein QM820_18890 [Minicystis sp.]